jgi:hypothetical protein
LGSTLGLGLWCIHNSWCSYIKRFSKIMFFSNTCQHDKNEKQMQLAPFCLHNFKTQSIMKIIPKELNLNFNWKGGKMMLPTHDNGRHKDCLTFKIIKFDFNMSLWLGGGFNIRHAIYIWLFGMTLKILNMI